MWADTVEKYEQPKEDDAGLKESVKAYNLTCTALCICIKRNTYSDIENITNAKTVWTTLETNFKPQGSRYLNNTFWKLDSFTLFSYKSPSNYFFKFHMIVNKLQSFFIKIKLDENWLIYRFHINLGNKYSGYFENYSQEHDPLDDKRNTKHTLNFTM